MSRDKLLVHKKIIHRSSIGINHHSIEDGALLHRPYVICEYVVHKSLRILSGHEHFSHVRDIEHSHISTYRLMLVNDAAVLYRHIETGKRAHPCTQRNVPVMQTSLLQLIIHIVQLFFKDFQIFLENHLRVHHIHFLEKTDLVRQGEIHLIFVLALSPPFVEADGVIFKRNAGLDSIPISWIVYHELQAHKPLIILRVSTTKLADQRVKDFKVIHLQDFLADYKPVNPDRIHIQPYAHLERYGPLISIKGQLVH